MSVPFRHGTLLLFLFATMTGHLFAEDFTARVYTDPDGKTMPYRLLIPADYDQGKKYPIVFFFHGAGERGDNNSSQLNYVVQNFAKPEIRSKYPCFVVAPQCPKDEQWVDMPWDAKTGVRPKHPSAAMQLALKIFDGVTTEFNIDPDRVYVVGLSMGGYATWDCLTRTPDRFAAAIAICGGGDEHTVTSEVARVPVWAFHSSDDPIVPVVRSQNMVAAMTKEGGHPRYNEYEGLGHSVWDKAFAEPDFYEWLFAQVRVPPEGL